MSTTSLGLIEMEAMAMKGYFTHLKAPAPEPFNVV